MTAAAGPYTGCCRAVCAGYGPVSYTHLTKLNKLGGTEWAKTTRKAKAAAKDLAEGLIRLYAQRQRLAGHAFSPDSPWQQEFEDAFPYTETDDQLQACLLYTSRCV